MKLCRLLTKSLSVLLCLVIAISVVATPAFASQTNGKVPVPSVKGGETMEDVDVVITTTANIDGTTTTVKETANGGDITDSGLMVTYKSTENDLETSPIENTRNLIDFSEEYTITHNDSTYAAAGGRNINIKNIKSSSPISVSLISSGIKVTDPHGTDNTSRTNTLPSKEGKQTKEENSANYDQTTETIVGRSVSFNISKIETQYSEPIFEGEQEPAANNDYLYFYVDGYDGIEKFDSDGTNIYKITCNIVDENGSFLRRVKGETIYNMFVEYKNTSNPDDPRNGELIGGLYCADFSTNAHIGYAYRKVTPEDAAQDGYYTKADAAKLRNILNNGFVLGVDETPAEASPTGVSTNEQNIVLFRAKLKDAKDNNILTDTTIIDSIDTITWQQAALATQISIWTIANRIELGTDEYIQMKTNDELTNKLAKFLLDLADKNTYIEKEIAIKENSIKNLDVIVSGVVEDKSTDTQKLYSVDFKFSLANAPEEDDDLTVKILNEKSQTLASGKIPHDESDTVASGYLESVKGSDGTVYYLIKGIELSEDTNSKLTLKLEGIKSQTTGVFILQSELTQEGKSTSQNLIGAFDPNAKMDMSMEIDFKFNVTQSTSTTHREWRAECDGSLNTLLRDLGLGDNNNPNNNDNSNNNNTNNDGTNEDTLNNDKNLTDNIPQTGDNSKIILWVVILIIAGIIIWKTFGYIKRKK